MFKDTCNVSLAVSTRSLVIRLEMRAWCLALLLTLFPLHFHSSLLKLKCPALGNVQHWWLWSEFAKMSDNDTGKKEDNVSPSRHSIQYLGFSWMLKSRHSSYQLIPLLQLKSTDSKKDHRVRFNQATFWGTLPCLLETPIHYSELWMNLEITCMLTE